MSNAPRWTSGLGIGGDHGRCSAVAERRHHVPVLDRVRRRDVNDPADVVVIPNEPHGSQEVVDLDPADPLFAGADPPAEAEPGEMRETIEGRSSVIEDDPGTHDDESVGCRALDCLLPGAPDAWHLRRSVCDRARLIYKALPGVAVDGECAHLQPQCRSGHYAGCGLDQRLRGRHP